MSDCLFCKISEGKIPSKIVYQDADLFAFEDIAPQAPTHILICTRKHLASLDDAKAGDSDLLGRALLLASRIAADRGLTGAYRTVVNTGAPAGQSVFHVHVHLLGGRPFHWPPG